MKKILLIISVLFCFAASGQRMHPHYSFIGVNIKEWVPVPNYTTINSRYFWLAGAFSALNIPAGGTAVRQTNQWNRSGMLFYDSTGADTGLYVSHGTNWVKVGSSSIPTLQQVFDVQSGNAIMTSTNIIDFSGNNFHLIADGAAGTENLNLAAWRTNVHSSGPTGNYVNIQSNQSTASKNNQITVSDSINILPFQGKLNIDTLVKGSIDTTTYKPMAWSSVRGDVVAMNSWAQVSGGSGGGTPGGSTTQVQYNDAGAFGGDAGMTYDATNNRLTLNAVTNNTNLNTTRAWVSTGLDIGSYFGDANVAISVASSQTWLFNFYNSGAANKRMMLRNTGELGVGDFDPSTTTMLELRPRTVGHAGLVVQGVASQSGNLAEFKNSGGTVLSSVGPGGSIQTTGFATAYAAKTTTYPIVVDDYTIEATSGTFTTTLPTAVGISGKQFVITNSGSGVVTLATTSSQTFINVTATPTTLTLNQFNTVIVQSNGANWLRISSL